MKENTKEVLLVVASTISVLVLYSIGFLFGVAYERNNGPAK